jgi:SpoIVB peptidase S55
MNKRWFTAAILAALLVPFPAHGQDPVPTFPLSEVRPGLKGVGRTIFQGEKVEEFQVEVLGVLKNATGPKHDVILARLAGGPLAKTGVILGMSGSPVYVDGKLLGAVALAFPLSTEPIAGITPIQEMLDVVPGTTPAAPIQTEAGRRLRIERAETDPIGRVVPADESGMFDWEKLYPAVARESGLSALRLPLQMSGFSGDLVRSTIPLFERMGFEPLAGALLSSGILEEKDPGPDAGKNLVPGSMVSMYLMRGDFNLNADCTVTMRTGNNLYACGHRFLMAGPTEFPFGESHVITTVPSIYASFKLDAPGPPLGAIRQDRFGAIYGVVGEKAPMVPVHIQLTTTLNKPESYEFEMVQDPFLTPALMNIGLVSALSSTERMVGPSTFEIQGGIVLANGEKVDVDDVVSADVNAAGMAGGAAAIPLSLLLGSGFPNLAIQDVHLSIVALNDRRMATLEQAWSSKSEVRPGDHIEITAVLSTPGGESVTERIPLVIPANITGKTLSVMVGSGATMNVFQNRFTPLTATPRDLEQLVRALNRMRHNNRVYALLMAPERSFVLQGDEYPSPPPSLVQTFLADPASLANVMFNGMSVIADAETKPSTYSIVGQRIVTLRVAGAGE